DGAATGGKGGEGPGALSRPALVESTEPVRQPVPGRDEELLADDVALVVDDEQTKPARREQRFRRIPKHRPGPGTPRGRAAARFPPSTVEHGQGRQPLL